MKKYLLNYLYTIEKLADFMKKECEHMGIDIEIVKEESDRIKALIAKNKIYGLFLDEKNIWNLWELFKNNKKEQMKMIVSLYAYRITNQVNEYIEYCFSSLKWEFNGSEYGVEEILEFLFGYRDDVLRRSLEIKKTLQEEEFKDIFSNKGITELYKLIERKKTENTVKIYLSPESTTPEIVDTYSQAVSIIGIRDWRTIKHRVSVFGDMSTEMCVWLLATLFKQNNDIYEVWEDEMNIINAFTLRDADEVYNKISFLT